ncbi:MAG: 5'-methylthioadenosine/adenosylhomocysteine nucleosidase [Tenericutes bacterium]|nr:5'-methylthioadenosine/adenosylhomocysteine nucleosidase [Mycoplasmatota bacterium]
MIGIIGAIDKELFLFFEEMTIEKTDIFGDKTFYVGKIKKHEVVVVKSGIGKVNAAITTAILITQYHARIVINTGVAGGLKPAEIGDIILAKGIAYFDVSLTEIDDVPYGQMGEDPLLVYMDETFLEKAEKVFKKLKYPYRVGNLVSGDKFVTSAKDIRKIKRHVDEIIGVEMEGMAIALTCHKFKVPFISIRGISDIIDSKNQGKVYHNISEEVARKTTKFTFKFIEVVDE